MGLISLWMEVTLVINENIFHIFLENQEPLWPVKVYMCFPCDFWCWLTWDCVPLNKIFLEEKNPLKAKIWRCFWCLYNNALCSCFSSRNQPISHISCFFSNLLHSSSCFRNLFLPPWIPHLLLLKGWKPME